MKDQITNVLLENRNFILSSREVNPGDLTYSITDNIERFAKDPLTLTVFVKPLGEIASSKFENFVVSERG